MKVNVVRFYGANQQTTKILEEVKAPSNQDESQRIRHEKEGLNEDISGYNFNDSRCYFRGEGYEVD